jgi:flagellar biosynthesis protein FlhB
MKSKKTESTTSRKSRKANKEVQLEKREFEIWLSGAIRWFVTRAATEWCIEHIKPFLEGFSLF